MKFGDLNVSDYVVTGNFLLCSGVVSLIKESEVEGNINSNLFTTTFSPYLLHFFTVNYALRLNLTILRLNKHRFFKIRLYRKGHTVIDHTER
jgi:hypothetical protein